MPRCSAALLSLIKSVLEETTQCLEKSLHTHTHSLSHPRPEVMYVRSIKIWRCLHSSRSVCMKNCVWVEVCFPVCALQHVSSSSRSHRVSQWFSAKGHVGGGRVGVCVSGGKEAQACWRQLQSVYFEWDKTVPVIWQNCPQELSGQLVWWIMMFAVTVWVTHRAVIEGKLLETECLLQHKLSKLDGQ